MKTGTRPGDIIHGYYGRKYTLYVHCALNAGSPNSGTPCIVVHGLALANRGDGRAATRARRTSTPRHSTLERLNTQAQPTVLKYDGIASEEVGCSETPGYPLLHAAEGDRLRLSTIGFHLGKSGLLAVGELYRLPRMHAVGHDDIPGSPTG